MRIFIVLLLLSGFMPELWAAVVHLKDGRSIEGTVIEQNDKSIKMDIDGVGMTYYADDIQDIDGKPLSAAASGVPGPSAVSPEKKALILKFMEITKLREGMGQSFEFMKKSFPEIIKKNLPEEAKKNFSEAKFAVMMGQKILDTDKIFNVDELLEGMIPVYDRNLSAEDLQGLINFYDSDVGQKLILASPAIEKEVMQYSMDYAGKFFAAAQNGQPAVPAAPPVPEPSAVSADKKALILKIMGSPEDTGKDIDTMAKSFPPQVAQLMKNKAYMDAFKQEMVVIYDRNLSTEELQGMVNFYDSDVGRKYRQATPVIMRESMQASQDYMKRKLQANQDYIKSIVAQCKDEENKTP